MNSRVLELLFLLGATLAALAWSAVAPHDRLTWWLEVTPVLAAILILIPTARRFPLTPLGYELIFVHAIILIVGGHYTSEKVPLGEWACEAFNLSRNHYDRLGHFAQGFIPALLTREVLIRCSPLKQGGWLFFLTTTVCLAISASFEFVEWGAAVSLGQSADAYLATQGDVWDTQWDMLCALCGAVLAQLLLGKWHDRQLHKLTQVS